MMPCVRVRLRSFDFEQRRPSEDGRLLGEGATRSWIEIRAEVEEHEQKRQQRKGHEQQDGHRRRRARRRGSAFG
jgi:hypothetical protein